MTQLKQLRNNAVGCAECGGSAGMRYYNITSQLYNMPRSVVVEDNCNGFTVKNTGLSTVLMNGIPVIPGESLSIGGNEGEIYLGRLDISFTAPEAPTTANNAAWVIQKFYVDKNF